MQLLAEVEKWNPESSKATEARSEFEEWRAVLFSLTPKGHKYVLELEKY